MSEGADKKAKKSSSRPSSSSSSAASPRARQQQQSSSSAAGRGAAGNSSRGSGGRGGRGRFQNHGGRGNNSSRGGGGNRGGGRFSKQNNNNKNKKSETEPAATATTTKRQDNESSKNQNTGTGEAARATTSTTNSGGQGGSDVAGNRGGGRNDTTQRGGGRGRGGYRGGRGRQGFRGGRGRGGRSSSRGGGGRSYRGGRGRGRGRSSGRPPRSKRQGEENTEDDHNNNSKDEGEEEEVFEDAQENFDDNVEDAADEHSGGSGEHGDVDGYERQNDAEEAGAPSKSASGSGAVEARADASPAQGEAPALKHEQEGTNGHSAKVDQEAASPAAVLSLPTPPPSTGGRGVLILSRQKHPPGSKSAPEGAKKNQGKKDKKNKRMNKPKKSKKSGGTAEAADSGGDLKTPGAEEEPHEDAEEGDDDEYAEQDATNALVEPTTVTSALKSLPAQQVSITASDTVSMNMTSLRRNNESVASFKSGASSENEGIGHGQVQLLQHSKTESAATGKTKKKKKAGADNKKEAAMKFNHQVRNCIDIGDAEALRKLLRSHASAHGNKYALDASTLETVLKALLVAAMLDDALFCLRHVTKPGTLSTAQTEKVLTCLPQNLQNASAFTAGDMIHALAIATDFGSDYRQATTCRTYFLRIVRGIALEFLEEATSARDRICSAPCERLVRTGLCVVDARLVRGKKPTELVVQPGDQLGLYVPPDSVADNRGIQAGDAVSILPYAGPYPMSSDSLDRNMTEATVVNTHPMVLRLQDKTNVQLHAMLTEPVEGNVYRIDKLANRMGFNRQLNAAVAIASPLEQGSNPGFDPMLRDVRRPCPELIKAITAMDENIDRVYSGVQRKAPTSPGTMTSTAALCAQAIPWSLDEELELAREAAASSSRETDFDEEGHRARMRQTLEANGYLEGLNASQRLAVEGASCNRLTLVQGPPGTGKTAVAIRILEHWAKLAQEAANSKKKKGRPVGQVGDAPLATPILATSDSNIAVDNLVDGCAAVGLKVIRLGRPEAIRPELLRFCIDRPPSSYQSRGDRHGDHRGQSYNPSMSNHKERMKQLKSAQVICCTCIGSGGDILDALGPLDHVLVDEATQATEAAVLVPLMRGCRQLVLVGDHCQLPPTVLSTRAEEEGHGVPLFSRMVACGVPPFMLDTQYRMHPGIAMFPSDLFYGGLLKNGVSAPERRPLSGFPWPREEFPVAFLPVRGIEMDDGVSKYNEAEAAAACDAVVMLLQGGQCRVSDIAVVTPYAAQARLIRRMVRRLELPQQHQAPAGGGNDDCGPPFIEVSSVDGFQGREKEAVVFSAVRSNDYGQIGFTSDWRRINVSFTRARRALIVIGNDQTLRRGDPDTWMPWLAWADAYGLNMDKPGVPRGRYEPEQLRRVRGGTTAAEMLKDVLERQQAQLERAEQQQERAERKTRGQIMLSSGGSDDAEDGQEDGGQPLSLEEDLALMANTEGNWDDDEDDEEAGGKTLRQVPSRTTLSSGCSSDERSVDAGVQAIDIWDM